MMAGHDLEDLFQETHSDQQSDETYHSMGISTPPLPPHTRRQIRIAEQKKHRRRTIRATIIVVLLVVFAAAAWYVFSNIRLQPNSAKDNHTVVQDYPGPGTGSVEFTVSTGDSASVIGEKLAKKGIVASASVFTQAVTNAGAESRLQPGTFSLRYKMSADDVVAILTDTSKAKGMLEVKPGARVSDVVTEASALSGIAKDDFQEIIDAKGEGILPNEAGGSFEGWLEPGSYDVKTEKSAKALLKKLVDKRIAKFDSLKLPTGEEREKIIKIASIVEAEVNKSEYYGKVSRVVYNRLDIDMSLGMDSVVAYGLGIKGTDLTNAQLADSSNPYNSRIHKGLPPTPISNPGDEALKAAMNPENGDWLYFVTVNLDTGETKFTADVATFDTYVKQYKDWEKKNSNN